ncbi:molybdate ABC transporter substrate-binding protein [Kaarinaea lacus]
MHKPVRILLSQRILPAVFLLVSCVPAIADEIRIAVASNFAETMKVVATQFQKQTGHRVILAPSSTGKHFAQISNGAPFDAFFAADIDRPALLEKKQRTIPGTRFTYAIGRLVLWSSKNDYVDSIEEVLEQGNFKRLAIANPRLAPYGKAAQQVLQAKGLWSQTQSQIVRGENIAQTLQFVKSGNAALGFLALSQILQINPESKSSYWVVEPSLYDPIEQQAVLLIDKPVAHAFMAFISGEEGRAIIQRNGYDTP